MKFKFDFSFFLMIIFMIGTGNIKYFFLIYAFVLLHELLHVFTAKIFGIKTDEIILTGFGANARIFNFNFADARKKFWILFFGPFANFILFVVFKFVFSNDFCARANFLLCFFNLLPIYPLDGGKIFLLALKKMFGTSINIFFLRFNRFMILGFFCLGLLQFFFFMPNFSLFAIALYIAYVNKTSFVNLISDLYLY